MSKKLTTSPKAVNKPPSALTGGSFIFPSM